MYLDHNPLDDITEEFEPSKFSIVFEELYGAPMDILESVCDEEVIASCVETVNAVLDGTKLIVNGKAADWPKPF